MHISGGVHSVCIQYISFFLAYRTQVMSFITVQRSQSDCMAQSKVSAGHSAGPPFTPAGCGFGAGPRHSPSY